MKLFAICTNKLLYNRYCTLKLRVKKIKLIIFDKDGTLICFHSLWKPWLDNIVESIDILGKINSKQLLYKSLGYDEHLQKFVPGIVAEGTVAQTKNEIKRILTSQLGNQTDEIVDKAFDINHIQFQNIILSHDTHKVVKPDQPYNVTTNSMSKKRHIHDVRAKTNDLTIKQLADLRPLWQKLREKRIKLALCTADDRNYTMDILGKLGNLQHLLDSIVCGDDLDSRPKPNPANALKICRELGVPPEKTAIIGDTKADLQMGHSAKLGLVVGVLSGVGNKMHLEQANAHHIVTSVAEFGDLILQLVEGQVDTDENDKKCLENSKICSAQNELKKDNIDENPHIGTGVTSNTDLTDSMLRPKTFMHDPPHRTIFSSVIHSSHSWFKQIDKRFFHQNISRRFSRSISNAPPLRIIYPFNKMFYKHFWTQRQDRSRSQLTIDQAKDKGPFDYIIVGAGSAGCVLANRLSADRNNKVLLIEAGPPDAWWNWKIKMPAALMYNLCDDKYNWFYHTVPQFGESYSKKYWFLHKKV